MNIFTTTAATINNGICKLSNYVYTASGEVDNDALNGFSEKFKNLVNSLLPWVLGLMAIGVAAWGAYLGIKYMLAKKAEQKVEAKDYIKNFFMGLILAVVVGALGAALIPALAAWAGVKV